MKKRKGARESWNTPRIMMNCVDAPIFPGLKPMFRREDDVPI